MILRARWVVPILSPPIERGAVAFDAGTITAIGRADELRSHDDAVDLGDIVLMPGLINAHTHLELSCYAGRIAPTDFWSWLDALIALRRAPGAAPMEQQAIVDGARQSLLAGVTGVADISRSGTNLAALRAVPIRKIAFIELISGAATPPGDPEQLLALLDDALKSADDRTTVGISPHALYSVAWNDLRRVAAIAAERDLPVTLHVAESPDELEWLRDGTGRTAEFLQRYGLPNARAAIRGNWMDLLSRAGLTRLRPVLAHANYVDDTAWRALTGSAASVAYCPRTHEFFRHPPHRWRDMIAAGVNVCVGTDSLASNPSLSIRAELAELARGAPDLPPQTIVGMATRRAARALGLERTCGALHPGLAADLVAIELPTHRSATPWAAILDESCPVRDVWVAGRRCVENGSYVE